jgi:hypothetical protein
MASASLSSAGWNPRADDSGLVGIALAGDEALDRTDGDALIGDVVVLALRGQYREPTAKRMCRVDTSVIAHLFVHDQIEPAGLVLDLGEPVLEAQESHPAALPAVEPELGRSARNRAVGAGNREASGGAEIEGKDHVVGGTERQRRRRVCDGGRADGVGGGGADDVLGMARLRRENRHGDLLEVRAVGAKSASGRGCGSRPNQEGSVRSDQARRRGRAGEFFKFFKKNSTRADLVKRLILCYYFE